MGVGKTAQIMNKKPDEIEVSIPVKIPRSGYSRSMYFNRFRIEKIDAVSILYFGLVVPSVGLADYYCCSIPDGVLIEQRDNFLTYLDRMGRAKEKPTPWQTSPPQPHTDVADIINLAHNERVGEIVLASFSQWALNLSARDKNPATMEATPVAMLRSDVEVQKQFLEALYA